MKKYIFYSFIVATLAVASCNDQNENQSAPASQALRFNSITEFEAATNKIPAMTDAELDAWEKEQSFVSYRSVLKKATQEWQSISSETAKSDFMKRYDDILQIENDELVPRIHIPLYQAIVNREGIYETEGFVHKITGDFIATVSRNEYQKLNKINLADNTNLVSSEKGVSIARFINSDPTDISRKASTCSTKMETTYFHNESNCRHDRKVTISAQSYLSRYSNYEGDWWQPRVKIYIQGIVRTSTFCRWETYMTFLQWRNVSYTVDGWTFADNVATPATFSVSVPDYQSPADVFNKTDDRAIGDRVLNYNISPAPFTKVHAEGSSRGIEGNWAIIDCQ